MKAPARRQPAPRLGVVAVLVAVAGGILAAFAPAALAVESVGVVEPADDSTVRAAFRIAAGVTTSAEEDVVRVEVLLLRGGGEYGVGANLDHVGGPTSGGRSTWAAPLDPWRSWAVAGRPMPNGAYRIQVRAFTVVDGVEQDPTPWRGADMIVDVPAPSTVASVRLLDAARRTVEVSWQPTDIPDHTRYVVERSADGGPWQHVAERTSQRATTLLDTAPADGTYAYRVTVWRAAGHGGERPSVPSSSAVVQVAAAEPAPSETAATDSAQPPPPPPPDDGTSADPGSSGTGDAGSGGGASGGGPPAAGDGGTQPQQPAPRPTAPAPVPQPPTTATPTSRPTTSSPSTIAPSVPGLPVSVPTLVVAAPSATPAATPQATPYPSELFDDDLGYEVPAEATVTESERILVDEGGTSTRRGGFIQILVDESDQRRVMPLVAGGLVLTLAALHVARFLYAGSMSARPHLAGATGSRRRRRR